MEKPELLQGVDMAAFRAYQERARIASPEAELEEQKPSQERLAEELRTARDERDEYRRALDEMRQAVKNSTAEIRGMISQFGASPALEAESAADELSSAVSQLAGLFAAKRAAGGTALDLGALRPVRELGRGSYGSVMLCEDPRSSRPVAVKQFRGGQLEFTESFWREVRKLDWLRHPCVVSMLEFSPSQLKIATEFMAGGSLGDALRRKECPLFLSETSVAVIVCELVLGMQFVHSRGEIHSDLKPDNVLLDANGHAKLGDFGMCQALESARNLAKGIGTLRYMAPELADGECTAAVDAYSFGLILFEILTGSPVWNISAAFGIITAAHDASNRPNGVLDANGAVHARIKEVIRSCWQADPGLRPSFQGIFEVLVDIGFKITAGVDPSKVEAVVANIRAQEQQILGRQ
jgi:hypothetical protein